MSITGQTKIVGVIGWPLTYTLSPTMHNAAIQKAGLDYAYLAFPIHPDRLEKAVRGLQACGVRGLNVTIPHKESVFALMDELSVEAQAIGAVNTICIDAEKMRGANTDVYGFVSALRDVSVVLEGKRVAVAGAGGAGRAIVAAALLEGASDVALWDIEQQRADRLVSDLARPPLPPRPLVACKNEEQKRSALTHCDIFVNASPVGMKPDDPSPIDVTLLPEGCMIFDAVYNIPETTLLRQARERGLTALGGLTMLMYQGARSFEIWFGVKPDTDLMLAKMREHLKLE